MLLRIPEPYDFVLSTTRFREFGSDRATVWHEGGLHRVVAGREVRITAEEEGVAIEPWSPEVGDEVGRLLGLPFDLDAFRGFAVGDATLAMVVGSVPGFRPTLNPEPFEALVVAITAQQISLHAAASIRGRSRRTLSACVTTSPGSSRRRSGSRSCARGTSRRSASRARRRSMSSSSPIATSTSTRSTRSTTTRSIAAVTSARGLGRWTADWFLARHLARPHAWPAGDLGVRKAVSTFYADGRRFRSRRSVRMGERFAPFENLSASTCSRARGWPGG